MRARKVFRYLLMITGGTLMIGMTTWVLVGVVSVAGIETPQYEVESQHDGYVIRRYAPHIVAEVTMEGNFDSAMNGGFRKLASYIFGNNTAAAASDSTSEKIAMTAPVLEQTLGPEKIAMTAPVLEQQLRESARVVAFVMPAHYTMETLPQPNNDEVRLVQIPERRYAVLRFSGRVNEARAEKMKAALLELLERDNLQPAGEPSLAQYNPPWTPPPMRRNEILVQIAEPA